MDADVIVVGSGASGAHAAWPLAEAGARVLMLDVGHVEDRYGPLIPDAPFLGIRRTDPAQHRYFLGDDFEGVPFGKVRVGAQLTPPRQFIARDTDRLTPLVSSSFAPTESLALGGLGAGWGASAVRFDDRDLAGTPIRAEDLAPHYDAVAARIGISGERDDLLPFYGPCETLQPPLEMDPAVRALLERYRSRRGALNRAGLYMGRPRLAVLTRDLDGRSAQRYQEMEFYADAGGSVYRPGFTVEAMRRFGGFSYQRPWLVERFREVEGGAVEVSCRHAATGERAVFTAGRLILAAGALGTARIVLRSLGRYDRPVPLACNAHIYVPCVSVPSLGSPFAARRHSLTQAGIIFAPDGDGAVVYVEAHGYRPLLMFKLAKESFLPAPDAVRILRDLLGALVILVIEHEDRPTAGKTCRLRRGDDGADFLQVDYAVGADQAGRERDAERRLLRLIRGLGCWPVGRVDPGAGSSIHYGGTVPMSAEPRELTVTPGCLLRGTSTVYLADGSVLPWLPAKPLTFTLMANAHRVGTLVRETLA